MQLISLFSGIGGFELAASWVGWDTVVSCEINPFGRRVLEYHFPHSYHHDDIHTLNYEKIKEKSRWDEYSDTIVCGGFPCQPYSTAGKRLGKEDERHLWPEMLRVIREVKPKWVVGENVLGLVNWNGGLVFEEVQSDLEAEGYEVQPFVLPACAVNAPHRRDRVWFVAYSISARTGRESGEACNEERRTCENWGEVLRQIHGEAGSGWFDPTGSHDGPTTHPNNSGDASLRCGVDRHAEAKGCEWKHTQPELSGPCNERTTTHTNCDGINKRNGEHEVNASEGRFDALGDADKSVVDGNTTNTNSKRREEYNISRKSNGKEFNSRESDAHENVLYANGTSEPREYLIQTREREFDGSDCGIRNNRFQNFPTQSPICGGNDGLPAELDGITISKWRTESIKAYGNAIVPQIAERIFIAINEYNKLNGGQRAEHK